MEAPFSNFLEIFLGRLDVTGLYHKDIGFPAGVTWPLGSFPLRYSIHARQEARRDRFGDIEHLLPRKADMKACQVIEVKVEKSSRRIESMVLRMPLDGRRDLVLVVVPEKAVWFVKTVYLNLRADQHKTLNIGRYDRPAA